MTIAKCMLAGLWLTLLSGCVVREERGADFDRGHGEYHDEGRGGEHEHEHER